MVLEEPEVSGTQKQENTTLRIYLLELMRTSRDHGTCKCMIYVLYIYVMASKLDVLLEILAVGTGAVSDTFA